jgi:clan AA aspartic protease (TIGR02281 family)
MKKINFLLFILFFFSFLSIVDAETVRYYEKPDGKSRNMKFLKVLVNGIPVEMIFDTGASGIVLTKETYKKIGSPFILGQGKNHTAGGVVPAYFFKLFSVKLGSIEARNIIASTHDGLEVNILGADFFKHFNYFVNEREKAITFTTDNSFNNPFPGDDFKTVISGPNSSLKYRVRDKEQ